MELNVETELEEDELTLLDVEAGVDGLLEEVEEDDVDGLVEDELELSEVDELIDVGLLGDTKEVDVLELLAELDEIELDWAPA